MLRLRQMTSWDSGRMSWCRMVEQWGSRRTQFVCNTHGMHLHGLGLSNHFPASTLFNSSSIRS